MPGRVRELPGRVNLRSARHTWAREKNSEDFGVPRNSLRNGLQRWKSVQIERAGHRPGPIPGLLAAKFGRKTTETQRIRSGPPPVELPVAGAVKGLLTPAPWKAKHVSEPGSGCCRARSGSSRTGRRGHRIQSEINANARNTLEGEAFLIVHSQSSGAHEVACASRLAGRMCLGCLPASWERTALLAQ
jgi:hypothetical protein